MSKARDGVEDLKTIDANLAAKAPLASPVFTGNVGVGSALLTTTASNMLQLGSTSNLSWYNQGDDELDISVNAINNSGNKYIETKAASQYIQQAGAHHFKVAASGTAGAAISWTNAMTIDNAGGVSIAPNVAAPVGGLVNIRRDNTNIIVETRSFNTSGQYHLACRTAANSVVGGVSVSGSQTNFVTSSDYRLKENVTPMSGATAQTKLLKPCNFDWIAGGNVNGFIAHELAEVVPEAVTGTKDAMRDEEYEVTPATDTEAAVMGTRSVPDMQGIDQAKLVPLLTATIQELITRIEALEA